MPLKHCPTGVPETICSGNGNCSYTDLSGNTVAVCNQTNVNCAATCQCVPPFSGVDCSLTPEVAAARALARTTMCEALLNATRLSDPSAELLVTLTSSLKQSYDPHQVYRMLVSLSFSVKNLDYISFKSINSYSLFNH